MAPVVKRVVPITFDSAQIGWNLVCTAPIEPVIFMQQMVELRPQ